MGNDSTSCAPVSIRGYSRSVGTGLTRTTSGERLGVPVHPRVWSWIRCTGHAAQWCGTRQVHARASSAMLLHEDLPSRKGAALDRTKDRRVVS